MIFTGIGGTVAIIVILAICAVVFIIGIRKELD